MHASAADPYLMDCDGESLLKSWWKVLIQESANQVSGNRNEMVHGCCDEQRKGSGFCAKLRAMP